MLRGKLGGTAPGRRGVGARPQRPQSALGRPSCPGGHRASALGRRGRIALLAAGLSSGSARPRGLSPVLPPPGARTTARRAGYILRRLSVARGGAVTARRDGPRCCATSWKWRYELRGNRRASFVAPPRGMASSPPGGGGRQPSHRPGAELFERGLDWVGRAFRSPTSHWPDGWASGAVPIILASSFVPIHWSLARPRALGAEGRSSRRPSPIRQPGNRPHAAGVLAHETSISCHSAIPAHTSDRAVDQERRRERPERAHQPGTAQNDVIERHQDPLGSHPLASLDVLQRCAVP